MQVVVARVARQDRADAEHRDPGAARAVEDVGDRLHAHQHVLLGDAVGEERRVDQEGLAAELSAIWVATWLTSV